MQQVLISKHPTLLNWKCLKSTQSSSSICSLSHRPILRYAVLGAGFAGLSVAYNLLRHGPNESHVCVDIYDELGIGGGASGVAGGLLHPYSPKVKLLWQGAEFWKESLNLINIAEAALRKQINTEQLETLQNIQSPIVRRRGILRPAINSKHIDIMTKNAQNYLTDCRVECINEDAAQCMAPNLSIPLSLAFHMPDALNIDAQSYLQGLYMACRDLVSNRLNSGFVRGELSFHKKSVQSLQELSDDYDAVIICLGAKAVFLPELSGKLPLRTCRGIILNLQLNDDMSEEYPNHGPSILSDAWLSVKGPRRIDLGSTWDWNSFNHSTEVSKEEISNAIQTLLPKASSVYPSIKDWTVKGAVGGLRAMPPLTEDGSLPLVGCVDDFVKDEGLDCKYWLFGGLGARGLLFHGWLGKILARAVMARDESFLPVELTLWKGKMDHSLSK